ncbi:MAG: hypothetical protein ABI610_10605 [Acidobacteriota bacterium]
MTLRRWIEYLVAVLVGNAIYFLVLFPALPQGLRHEPLRMDAGLLLAFLCCVGVYGVIRMASRHAQDWNRKSETLRPKAPTGKER